MSTSIESTIVRLLKKGYAAGFQDAQPAARAGDLAVGILDLQARLDRFEKSIADARAERERAEAGPDYTEMDNSRLLRLLISRQAPEESLQAIADILLARCDNDPTKFAALIRGSLRGGKNG
jgi:hypothetical protein